MDSIRSESQASETTGQGGIESLGVFEENTTSLTSQAKREETFQAPLLISFYSFSHSGKELNP